MVSGLVLNGPHNEPKFRSLIRKTWTTSGAATAEPWLVCVQEGVAREL